MIRGHQIILLICLGFIFFSCEKKEDLPNDIVASYGKDLLTEKEINGATVMAKNSEDSFFLATKFIRNWMKREVLIDQANKKLGELSQEQQKLIDTYEQDLKIHELRKLYIKELANAKITNQHIRTYYQSNKKNFELKENIVQLYYIKIPNQYNNFDRAWWAFQKNNTIELNKLTEYVNQNDGYVFNNTEKWLRFVDVLKELPINLYNEEHFLSNNQLLRIRDKAFTYFIKIVNFKIKDDLSPFEFEKEKIREILINKRKISYLDSFENELIRQAINNNQLKLYQ